MTVSYKLIPAGNLGAPHKGRIYMRPSVVTNETLTPDMFIDKYSKKIKFTKADILYFMYSLQEFLVNELKEGNIVQTGVLGTFYPAVSQIIKGKSEHADYSKDNLEAKITYRPDAEMIKELRKAELEKVRT
jgi:hypothetical protein